MCQHRLYLICEPQVEFLGTLNRIPGVSVILMLPQSDKGSLLLYGLAEGWACYIQNQYPLVGLFQTVYHHSPVRHLARIPSSI